MKYLFKNFISFTGTIKIGDFFSMKGNDFSRKEIGTQTTLNGEVTINAEKKVKPKKLNPKN